MDSGEINSRNISWRNLTLQINSKTNSGLKVFLGLAPAPTRRSGGTSTTVVAQQIRVES